MDVRRFWKVAFFASFVLVIETVIFKILMFLFDFFSSTSVISYAVLGVGLGAFAASRIKASESILFFWCTVGTTLSMYIVGYLVSQYPVLPLISAATSLCVFFPVIYVAVLFRTYPGGRVYLYDMAGAGLGVVLTVILYTQFISEGIILFLTSVVPLMGLYVLSQDKKTSKKIKILGYSIGAPLVIVGITMFSMQVVNDTFNIYRIFDREGPYEIRTVYKTQRPENLIKSYDSLVTRIDLLKARKRGDTLVSYNGYVNDYYTRQRQRRYEYYHEKGIRYPTGDRRVFYGLAEEPSIFIIGSSTRGILNTIRKHTPADKIYPVEIDPNIIRIATRDFYRASGRTYENLNPVVGNALSLLRSLDREFDMITMINTHSGRSIGYRSGPDFLHTYESYSIYLDHLSDDGCILFEERPYYRSGMLGVYRMVNTMWHALRARGVEDPSQHFLIWDWDVTQGDRPEVDPVIVDENRQQYRHAQRYYVGMIVTKSPIAGERLKKVLDWHQHGVRYARINFLKGVADAGEFAQVFRMIETGDFSPLEGEGFDSSLLTNDRPFASLSTNEYPENDSLLKQGIIIFLILSIVFCVGLFSGTKTSHASFLSSYNMLIGFGYFFIEIMLVQIYNNVFVSPSWSLVLVLGALLISSGVGGVYAMKLKPWQITVALIPISLLTVMLPNWFLEWGVPSLLSKILGVVLICATGFLMGFYFPRGLIFASDWKLGGKIPHLFAINSVAGAFAVVLALYLGVRIGYQATIIIAVICYCVAGLLVTGKHDESLEASPDPTPPDEKESSKKLKKKSKDDESEESTEDEPADEAEKSTEDQLDDEVEESTEDESKKSKKS